MEGKGHGGVAPGQPCQAKCGKQLHPGDVAYEQEYREITVVGTKVNERMVIRVVCESCAKEK